MHILIRKDPPHLFSLGMYLCLVSVLNKLFLHVLSCLLLYASNNKLCTCFYSFCLLKTFWLQIEAVQFSCSVMSDSATPWTAACQASLSITNFWSLLISKLISIESMMPSNHLILCRPLARAMEILLLASIPC